MDRLIALWLNMTVEQLVITLLILSNIGLWIRAALLSNKYQLLNTLISNHAWIIFLKLGVKTIRNHRSKDIEIIDPLNEIE